MRTFAWLGRITFPLVCAALIGCGETAQHPPVVERPLPTPEEAVSRFVSGVARGDVSALDVVRGTADDHLALQENMAFANAAIEFREAFVLAYGPDAWVKFQDEAYSPGNDGNARLLLPDPDADHAPQIEVKGDEVVVLIPHLDMNFRLVKTGSGWLVDGRSIFPAGTEPKQAAELMRRLTALVSKYRKAIGKPGIKPDDIDAELGRAFMGEMGMKTDAPHRFDIDAMQP